MSQAKPGFINVGLMRIPSFNIFVTICEVTEHFNPGLQSLASAARLFGALNFNGDIRIYVNVQKRAARHRNGRHPGVMDVP